MNIQLLALLGNDKLKKTIIVIILFLMTMQLSHAQKLLHTFQFNGGLISSEEADIYVGKIDYLPQLKWDNPLIHSLYCLNKEGFRPGC